MLGWYFLFSLSNYFNSLEEGANFVKYCMKKNQFYVYFLLTEFNLSLLSDSIVWCN